MINDSGISYNATTTKESTFYYFNGMSNNTALCLEALKSMITENRNFDKDIFENEKKIIEREAASFYSSFNQIIERTGQALYGNNSIGKIVVGTLENIKNTEKSDIETIIQNSYTPENSSLKIFLE